MNSIKKNNALAHKRKLAREDSRIIQSELLAYGFPTLRMPKLSLMVKPQIGHPQLAFIEGEGFGTSLVAQRLMARSVLWRPILAQALLPVAESVSLRSKQTQYAKQFAKQHGYPLVARSSLSEQGEGRGIVIDQESDIAPAMSNVYKEYGSGKTIIQKFYGATRVLALASSDSVLASLNCNGWEPFQLSQDLEKICVEAVKAIPGLSTALVELTLFVDPRHAKLSAIVTDISVTAGLQRFNSIGASDGNTPISALVRFEAENADLQLGRYKTHIKAEITIQGTAVPEEEMLRLQSFAHDLGLELELQTPHIGDSIQGHVDGSTVAIATFVEALVERGVSNFNAHLIELYPCN